MAGNTAGMTVRHIGPGFSGREAADIARITYRQLDYWCRTNLIRPSLVDAKGSGHRRRYSMEDVIVLKLIKTMLDTGIRLEIIRGAIEQLLDMPFVGGLLVVISEGSVRIIGKEDLLALDLNKPCQIFPIDIPDFEDELARLYPTMEAVNG